MMSDPLANLWSKSSRFPVVIKSYELCFLPDDTKHRCVGWVNYGGETDVCGTRAWVRITIHSWKEGIHVRNNVYLCGRHTNNKYRRMFGMVTMP